MSTSSPKTSAWPLALIYGVLIVYASLYPFSDWRTQGIWPLAFLTAPLPRYWTGFDLGVNIVGYAPFGFLLSLGHMRSTGSGHAWHAIRLATLSSGLLSLLMESTQNFLPVRVPSNVDFATNTLGAFLGAGIAATLERLGAIDRWSLFRARWFVPQARGALVLMALWPFALLFPAAVPFGVGQVLERLENRLAELLADTPFLAWLPVRDVELQPLVPGVAMLCVMLGLLIPCLLGYSVMARGWRRLAFLLGVVLVGCATTSLSAALSYGPSHAWAWLQLPVLFGMAAGVVLALLALAVPSPGCVGFLILALVLHSSLLNQAPASAYFWQTLQTWEQGRFIRFHGLAQWLGWVWPYLVLLYALLQISLPPPGPAAFGLGWKRRPPSE